jgi:type I restriction enzyme M protein
VRNFDFESLLTEIEHIALDKAGGPARAGNHWRAFDVGADLITGDGAFRLDLKYWKPETVKKIDTLINQKASTIASLNVIPTKRGKSPKAENYVDEKDGYALVVEAGTNITKFGELSPEGDFIAKDVYDDMAAVHLQKGDVLVASTGTGTLGKTCVFELDTPAIADGHVTIIRPNPSVVDPHYLADYLREGAGALQIERLYTGSTGLIELTPEDVDKVLVDLLSGVEEQKAASQALRDAESRYRLAVNDAQIELMEARAAFARPVSVKEVKVA